MTNLQRFEYLDMSVQADLLRPSRHFVPCVEAALA